MTPQASSSFRHTLNTDVLHDATSTGRDSVSPVGNKSELFFTRAWTDRTDRKTSELNRPLSPSLLEAIRFLLKRIEGTSYPTQDPIAIENIKAYLRCRIAELEVAEGLRPQGLGAIEPSFSPNTDGWPQAQGRGLRSPAIPAPFQQDLNEDEDLSNRNRPVTRSERGSHRNQFSTLITERST